jgi:aryl sulfotransferase
MKGLADMPELLRPPSREYRSVTMDSHRWDDFEPRSGDIIIGTYPKCGTTWTQRIVDLLIFQTPEPRPAFQTSPWLDAVIFNPVEDDLALLEAQQHRRFIKSHLPIDAVPIWDEVSYIHVARDGRDSCMSFHNHQLHLAPEFRARLFGDVMKHPRLVEAMQRSAAVRSPVVPDDPREFYLGWLNAAEASDIEGYGVDLPFFEFESTYWLERKRRNFLLLHYNDLTADLSGEMARIAEFLKIDVPKSVMPSLVKAARFDAMKRDAAAIMPKADEVWSGGADRFMFKGSNGRWRDLLTEEDLARYDNLVRARWSPAQAMWIEGGRRVTGDPRML